MQSNKIIFIIPYFGKFPEWAPLFFETVRKNASIDFLFYTDCDFKKYEDIPNALFHYITFDEYIENAKAITKINFSPANAYKLCDLRPLYPIIHFEDIKHYDFYGWTDMDILFGDIRSFYTDDLLTQFEVFSTHSVRVSGHMALFKNTPKYRNLYKKIYNWKNHLEHPYFVGIDEHGVTNALTMTFFDKLNEKMNWSIDNFFTRWLKKRKTSKLYMVEQYSTPFTVIPWLDGTVNSEQPDVWYYKDGVVANSRDGERKFMYLHFMNFKSSTYRHDSSKAPWEGKSSICSASAEDMVEGITINDQGIYKSSSEKEK
jgi:hypothetical protein